MKSNCQTTTIYCQDCDYLESNTIGGPDCQQFNEKLRTVRDGLIQIPVKGLECMKYGQYNPNVD